jgi:hypothetical protein
MAREISIMKKRLLTNLRRDEIVSLEILNNKTINAAQAAKIGFVPNHVAPRKAQEIYQKAFVALAEAQYLKDAYWQSLSKQHNVAKEKLYVTMSDDAGLYLLEE